jgi:tetratricopeptide (TPR) repeat protein
MAQVSCSRCFAVFEAEVGRPGSAPLCPACAPRAPAPAGPAARAAPSRASRRRSPRAALAVGIAVAALGGLAAALLLRPAPPPPPPEPTAIEVQVAEWRASGAVPAGAAPDPAGAAARVAEGRAALEADLPERTEEALRGFRAAIALAPGDAGAAVAGWATAFAEAAGEEPDGADLRVAHELVRDARSRSPARADLLAASARLILLAPGSANVAEARALAARAVAAAPGDGGARLALGLAQLPEDPVSAARTLEEAMAALPGDRRLLTAAARARWAAGDAAGALAHAEARLALDRGHAGALALRAEIEIASDRLADGRATLGRWEAAVPGSPLPPLLLARLAYQRDDDAPLARRLLGVALSRAPGAFTAARILAHRAAVELVAGNATAAEEAVAEALRRVPASAPARFQAALLAFRRGNAPALRESAGVLGDRAGPVVALLLAARSAELSGTDDEAQQAYLALAAAAPRDPAVLLGAAGALGRLHASGPALEVARRALARDPAEGRLRRAPTDFWEGPEPLAEAARRLEAIGRAEPSAAATAFSAAAVCELLLGRTVAAERLARAAGAASPQEATPHALLAQVALDRGQARAALPLVAAALDARPGDAVALAVHGRALEALGRNMDAEAAYRQAIEAGTGLLTPRLGLGRILARRGDAAGARAVLEEALREDPGLAEARGTLLALSGRVR